MSPKVKIKLTPSELQQLDGLLAQLIVSRNEADNYERCVMSVLLLWHVKIKRLTLWADPKGKKVELDAPTAYALCAVLPFDSIPKNDPLGVKLLQLSDAIQQAFFKPL